MQFKMASTGVGSPTLGIMQTTVLSDSKPHVGFGSITSHNHALRIIGKSGENAEGKTPVGRRRVDLCAGAGQHLQADAPGAQRNVSTTLIHPVREFKLGPLASFEAG